MLVLGPKERPDFCRLALLSELGLSEIGPLRVISEPLQDEAVELMLFDRLLTNLGGRL